MVVAVTVGEKVADKEEEMVTLDEREGVPEAEGEAEEV